MAKIPETINNGKRLDRLINETLEQMQSKGAKSNVRKSVGGKPKGLVIQITPAGSASWILRTTWAGKQREYGLGSYRRVGATTRDAPETSLSKARAEAQMIVDSIAQGSNPIATRRDAQKAKDTFKSCAKDFIAKEKSGWRNDKHEAQWTATLDQWVYPTIGEMPIEAVDLDMIVDVLAQPVAKAEGKPLWIARHVTAKRVRQRIEKVLDYAAARKLRPADNPARWPGPLARLLPKLPKKLKKVRSHPALPYADAPAFMVDLRERKGTAAQALQFLIYTAARSGEVRHAEWSEIDLDKALWERPDDKMKAGEAHTVPLSEPALAILRAIPESRRNGLVFPSTIKRDTAMSDMTLAAVLKRMKRRDITVHGFRATFRTWADSETAYIRNVKESAIAHTIGESDTERAYLRDDYLEQRKALMHDWAQYVTGDTN